MTFHIECPELDKRTPEENMAIMHTWMAEMTEKWNLFINQQEQKGASDGKN